MTWSSLWNSPMHGKSSNKRREVATVCRFLPQISLTENQMWMSLDIDDVRKNARKDLRTSDIN